MAMAETAVYVRGACKRYGGGGGDEHPVLDGLDMTVPRGCIYALLGASGCGKTTLLRCALGQSPLDVGVVRVLGARPNGPARTSASAPAPGAERPLAARIGYMPQDAALLGELTVREALLFYGRLFRLGPAQLERRLDLLMPMLQLPPDHCLLRALSGGQQRRVSLAVALVHEPELLVLDEPTVGLDPLLRQIMWDYLLKLTAGGKATVIITTHYIEEAQQAHVVGLMRLGKLLVEDSPKTLMSSFNCTTLDDVFITLSLKQDNQLQEIQNSSQKSRRRKSFGKKRLSESREEICMDHPSSDKGTTGGKFKDFKERICCLEPLSLHRLKALLIKNFLIMSRNPGNIAMILLFPLIQLSLFFLAVGGYPKGLKLAVVNEELGGFSDCKLFSENNRTNIFNYGNNHCVFQGISCKYLGYINESLIHLEYHNDIDSALVSAKLGKTIAMIYFHKNFSNKLENRIFQTPTIEDIEESQIQIRMDMTDQQTAFLVKSYLYKNYNQLMESLAVGCGVNSRLTHSPIQFEEPIYGPKYPKYKEFMIPGVLTSMSFFLATTLTALVMVRERQEGIWNRDIVAGVTSIEILLSHIISQSVYVFAQVLEILLASLYIYKMPCTGNIFLLFFILLVEGLCGLSFGIVVSVLCDGMTVAMYACLGIYVPFINLSGMIWPIQGMPKILRWFGSCLPTTLPTISASNVIQKGWTIFHPGVGYGILLLIVWIVGQVVFAICMLKKIYNTGKKT